VVSGNRRAGPRVIGVLKIAVGAALIIWMIRMGKLEPSALARAGSHWVLLVAAASIFYVQIAITAWRWNLLLRAQEIVVSLWEAFSLTMIGSLFNVVIPGSVGGDVIKGYYITRRAVDSKSRAVNTLLVDRAIGLLGLVILAAGGAIWNYNRVMSTAIRGLCIATILAAIVGTICLVAADLVGPRVHVPETAGRLLSIGGRVLRSMEGYHQKPNTLVSAVVLSVCAHGLACVTFYLCALAAGGSGIPFDYLLFIVPLGLVTTALPLSPAGVGVGQAAFYTLFQLVPRGDPRLGAAVFTVYQFIYLAVYLTGSVFYLAYRTKSTAQSGLSVRTS
jgi:uncharacterized protein (TIRG00374 family)